jgi:hypothetical protein
MITQSPATIREWGGEIHRLLRFPVPTDKNWSAFNPSIAEGPEGYLILIRSSNYLLNSKTGTLQLTRGADINSRLWLGDITEDLELQNLRPITFDHGEYKVTRGIEDARLVWRESGWEFTAVMLEPEHTTLSRLCLYTLDVDNVHATLVRQLEAPDPERAEKNWIPPNTNTEKFDFIYGVTSTIKHGKLTRFQDSDEHPELLGLRGGSTMIDLNDGTGLAVVHRVDIKPYNKFDPTTFGIARGSIRYYTHHFARYNSDGLIIALTPEFIFDKPGIEYAGGLVQMGDKFIVSYGSEDVSAWLAEIPVERILGLLEPISGRY